MRMAQQKSAEANIAVNIFWGICLCAAIAERLIVEGLNGVRLSGAALCQNGAYDEGMFMLSDVFLVNIILQ